MELVCIHVYHVLSLHTPSLLTHAAFLESRPTEAHLRAQVCPKVGRDWRAVCTYLNIQTTAVDKALESNKHDVNEAFFHLLCTWRSFEGATWGQLLKALREADLNAPVRELEEWMGSEAALVSCVGMVWGDASGTHCLY